MDIQYFKDSKHNYLIMKTEVSEENLFQYKMLENNKINGLLPFTLRNMDECYYLYYEIDSRQSLKNRYDRKKMSYEKLMNFFKDLVQTARNLGDYLLDPCHIILSPEGVFEELSSGRFSFIYDPGHEETADEAFMESIMEYADMEDERGAKLIYKLLDSIYDGSGIDFAFLENVIAEEKEEQQVSFIIDEVPSDNFPKRNDLDFDDDEDLDDDDDEKIQEKKIKIKLPISGHFLMAMLFAIVAGILVYLRHAYVLTYEESILDIAVFMVSIMMSLTCFLIQLRKNDKAFIRKKKDDNDEDDEDREIEPQITTYKEKEQTPKKTKNNPAPYIRNEAPIPEDDDGEETVLLTMDFGERAHKLYAEEGSELNNIDLGSLPVIVGKLHSCSDVIISDKSVSRMHAKIYKPDKGEDTVWIQDLNSTNGTYINGKRLMPNEEAPLKEDDEVSFGKCVYAFR